MAISGKTVLYGIIGDPVTHSLSPAMHNAALAASHIDAVYLPFSAPDISAAVIGIRGLGVQGLSVTIPHKESVMSLLDEIYPVAKQIGAVNTIVHKDGKLIGYNTDWRGAIRALEEKIDLMIEKKKELVEQIISDSKGTWITEMDDRQLMELFTKRLTNFRK